MKFLEIGKHKHNQSYSIGIIGGADGPTALYCSESVYVWLRKLLEKAAVLSAGIALLGCVLLFIRRLHRKSSGRDSGRGD